jgi:hypothetical protein
MDREWQIPRRLSISTDYASLGIRTRKDSRNILENNLLSIRHHLLPPPLPSQRQVSELLDQ